MRPSARIESLLLLLVWACCWSPGLRAQSSSAASSRCDPILTCEEFKELTGNRVYPKIIIDDVSFDGPVSLPQDVLFNLTRAMTTHVFESGSNWLDEIQEVPIRGAWQDHGYFKVLVSARAIPRGGDNTYQHFSVIVHVDEGKQYWIGDITFRSSYPDQPLVFAPEELRELLPFHEGDLVSADKIRQGLDALRKVYASKGYGDFTPAPETDVDEDRQRVSIHFVLDQQRQYSIGKITFCGTNSKFEDLIESEMRPGDFFDYRVIDAFFEKHRSELGHHFGPENVQYDRDLKTGIVDITVTLRNCPLSQE